MAKKTVTAPTVPEQTIYVGPALENGRLARFTIFRDGLPAHLSDLLESSPAIRTLIVPVRDLTAAQQLIQDVGTPEYAAFEQLKKGVR